MSHYTWHDYGYGICVSDIEVNSAERIEKLLVRAPQYCSEIHEELDEMDGDAHAILHTIEDYEDASGGCYGIASILRGVIREATGVDFLDCEDFDGNRYLIYTTRYPWDMSVEDKKMTKNKIKSTLVDFVSIISDSELRVEHKSVENGG